MKIRPAIDDLFHADIHTYLHDKANSGLLQFGERT